MKAPSERLPTLTDREPEDFWNVQAMIEMAEHELKGRVDFLFAAGKSEREILQLVLDCMNERQFNVQN